MLSHFMTGHEADVSVPLDSHHAMLLALLFKPTDAYKSGEFKFLIL
jgi:hypothetical protein